MNTTRIKLATVILVPLALSGCVNLTQEGNIRWAEKWVIQQPEEFSWLFSDTVVQILMTACLISILCGVLLAWAKYKAPWRHGCVVNAFGVIAVTAVGIGYIATSTEIFLTAWPPALTYPLPWETFGWDSTINVIKDIRFGLNALTLQTLPYLSQGMQLAIGILLLVGMFTAVAASNLRALSIAVAEFLGWLVWPQIYLGLIVSFGARIENDIYGANAGFFVTTWFLLAICYLTPGAIAFALLRPHHHVEEKEDNAESGGNKPYTLERLVAAFTMQARLYTQNQNPPKSYHSNQTPPVHGPIKNSKLHPDISKRANLNPTGPARKGGDQ